MSITNNTSSTTLKHWQVLLRCTTLYKDCDSQKEDFICVVIRAKNKPNVKSWIKRNETSFKKYECLETFDWGFSDITAKNTEHEIPKKYEYHTYFYDKPKNKDCYEIYKDGKILASAPTLEKAKLFVHSFDGENYNWDILKN